MRALPLAALCCILALTHQLLAAGALHPRLEGLGAGRVVVRVRCANHETLRREAARLGGFVRAVMGEIASVELPGTALRQLAALPDVVSIKPRPAYRPLNDISMVEIGAPAQAAEFGGTGRGAIVAVIDTGLDFRHPDFRNSDGTSRVLGIWDQTVSGSGAGCGPGFTFGRCFSKELLDGDLVGGEPVSAPDTSGHGTHVAGTAAGNGRAAGNGIAPGTFAGVAPEADLIIVKVIDDFGIFTGDMTAAYAWIAQQAAIAGKPFAINLSLGTDFGSHDGTDPDEVALDALLAPGVAGRAAAVASGNARLLGMHAEGTVGAGLFVDHPFLVPSYSPIPGSGNDEALIDLWYEGPDRMTVSLVGPSGNVLATAPPGAFIGACTASGQVWLDARNLGDPDNGDNEVVISLSDATGCGTPPAGATLKVRVTGITVPAGGVHHLWEDSVLGTGAAVIRFTAPSESSVVGMPATARNVTTAGSYVTRDCFPTGDPNLPVNCLGTTAPIGAASGFSSNGPTRDGRLKPEVAAPGERIASALSADRVAPAPALRTPDLRHRTLRGTSMAAPHVAGALAVLLGLNPSLDAVQARDLLMRGAREDGFTGATPNQLYGAGKLDLYGAVSRLLLLVNDVTAESAGGLSWQPEPHSAAYNLYRGVLPGTIPFDYGVCLAAGLGAPAYNDAGIPSPDSAFFYLVTGVSGGIEGSPGPDGAGSTRPLTHPCH